MNENYFVWGRIDNSVSRYMMIDDNGDKVPDLGYRIIVRRSLIALRKFFADNGLLKINIFDKDGNLIDMEYRRDDFTDEAIELLKRKVGAWLDSKGSEKDPPDMRILVKELAKIREGK
ncbi:hypothetical protein [Cupriavidus sp. SW-Y-13]|uniref:hypothetical protein n=1 Tax=Cupriavidus sp. SW-Y-13 TaxID=2653854 RepID=UPI0013651BA4|nr:hypothetical protein [Cupriavidus sp. SW-Y-13]MWL90442.1 hypothetical protein [Cupriavidus sp. SW-Y-13]